MDTFLLRSLEESKKQKKTYLKDFTGENLYDFPKKRPAVDNLLVTSSSLIVPLYLFNTLFDPLHYLSEYVTTDTPKVMRKLEPRLRGVPFSEAQKVIKFELLKKLYKRTIPMYLNDISTPLFAASIPSSIIMLNNLFRFREDRDSSARHIKDLVKYS